MKPDNYPQTNQPETAQQLNPFEGMDSPEQVLPRYERLMDEAAAKHQQKFTQPYNPANLGTYLNETSEEVGGIIATAAAALAPMLDEESSAMLTHIRGRAKLMGPDSFIVGDLVQAAPLAVRVVYDTDVLQQARKRTAAWGADLTESSPRRQILNNASSPTVLGAMNAALDKELHDYAQQQTPYERNTHGGKRVFNGASSEAVQEALEQQRASEHSQQTQGARADQSRSRTDSFHNMLKKSRLFDDPTGQEALRALVGSAAEDNPDSAPPHASRSQQTQGARADQPSRPREGSAGQGSLDSFRNTLADSDLFNDAAGEEALEALKGGSARKGPQRKKSMDPNRQLIDKLVEEDPGLGWLDPEEVAEFKASVEEMRAQGMSDRGINTAWRREADINPSPENTHRVHMLDALMGGPKDTMLF